MVSENRQDKVSFTLYVAVNVTAALFCQSLLERRIRLNICWMGTKMIPKCQVIEKSDAPARTNVQVMSWSIHRRPERLAILNSKISAVCISKV